MLRATRATRAPCPKGTRRIGGAVPVASTSQPPTVRSTLADQFSPVLHVHAELLQDCSPAVDLEEAQRRIRNGQVGYDALRVLQSCGDLRPRFVRVLDAFEVSGFVSNDDRRALLDGELDVDELVSGWFTGDRTPRDPRRRVARRADHLPAGALRRTVFL